MDKIQIFLFGMWIFGFGFFIGALVCRIYDAKQDKKNNELTKP